jgi:monofunctional biosynthetic peptidoglycan transglycosylase
MLTFFLFRSVFKWIFRIILAFVSLSLLWVVAYRFLNPPTTLLIQSRASEYGTAAKQEWVDYDQISDNMKLAVICGEDQRFKDHMGFDFNAIEKAIEHNIKSDKKRGASTISQQTAKNVFLWEGRSWVRKGLEVWFTILIEALWSKERILEVYLNIIELGPTEDSFYKYNQTDRTSVNENAEESEKIQPIFGVEAAAQYYFNKSASTLNKTQSAKLASILPCPRSCGMNSAFAIHHRAFVLRCMRRWGKKIML